MKKSLIIILTLAGFVLLFGVSFAAVTLLLKKQEAPPMNSAGDTKLAELATPSSYDKTTGKYVNPKYGFSFVFPTRSATEVVTCSDKPLGEIGESVVFLANTGKATTSNCDSFSLERQITVRANNALVPCDATLSPLYTLRTAQQVVSGQQATTCEMTKKSGAKSPSKYPLLDPEYRLIVQVPHGKFFVTFELDSPTHQNLLDEVLNTVKLFTPEKK